MFKDSSGMFDMKAVVAITRGKNGNALVYLAGNLPFQTATAFEEFTKGIAVDKPVTSTTPTANVSA